MDMKPIRNSLGRNPLSDASHRNPGVVISGQGPGRHPKPTPTRLGQKAMLLFVVNEEKCTIG